MNVKPGREIKLLGPELTGAVLMHPASQTASGRIAQLIEWLRACERPQDFYEFQRHLFKDVYQAEERRAHCSRIIKRLKRGGTLPADAPRPPHIGDAAELQSWELEAFVFERLSRQLRTVGDGLAWHCFGYDRRVVLTLSRNAAPGMMYGKDGLPYELGRVKELWDEKGHFALLHDLTNCLRIADLTEFTADGGILLREIKRQPHTDKKQMERIQAAIGAIMHGGQMPGGRPDARLVELREPYATNFQQLADLVLLAKQHGCRGMKLAQGRTLVAMSLQASLNRWGANYDKAALELESQRRRAIRRAGITNAMHHIKGLSADTASRSPTMAPWSIYPLSPSDCAALICDLLVFETTLSADALTESLHRAGLKTEILLSPADADVNGDMDVIRAYRGNRALTLHAAGLNTLLYELVKPNVWARGIAEALTNANPPAEPVLVFANEAAVWHQQARR